ncbi:MAG: tripartite tricarboxylate transporter substrate binding protein [Rhizobiales bacterium]|nr:tripartite tricarboxylate transporter substrate binding protein [Hyphomicrobiales bacterium]
MLGAAPRPAAAEDWPTRPVTLMVTFGPGGMMDYVSRSLASVLTTALGQPVIVEIKPGGGGVVGIVSAAKAAPDGYTLVVSAVGPLVFRPIMDKSVGYDVDKDLAPVILVGDTPNVLLAAPKLGVNTLKELVAYADKNQHRLSIAHPGPGTMGHLCGVEFAKQAHIGGNFIAYRAGTPIVADLLGGQIDTGIPAYGPGWDAVKMLAVGSEERMDFLPNVPTFKESGYNIVCSTWIAIYAPAGVPRPIVLKLNAAMDAFLRDPETRAKFSKMGLNTLGGSPERLRDRVIADRAAWSPILSGMSLDSSK